MEYLDQDKQETNYQLKRSKGHQRAVKQILNCLDEVLNQQKFEALHGIELEKGGEVVDIAIFDVPSGKPLWIAEVVSNKTQRSTLAKVPAIIQQHELIEAFVFNYHKTRLYKFGKNGEFLWEDSFSELLGMKVEKCLEKLLEKLKKGFED